MKRLLTVFFAFFVYCSAYSLTTVRPATDETLCVGSGLITLDSILVVEGSDGDFNPATAGKYYLKAPANFEFDISTLVVAGTSDISNISEVLTVTNDTLIITLDITTGGGLDTLSIVGLQIQAISTPVALDTIRAVTGPGVVNMNGNGYDGGGVGLLSHGRVTSLASETPSVSLGGSTLTICSGDNTIFTASPTDGGASPQYQFFNLRTGSVQGPNGTNTYSTTTLQDGDTIVVEMTNSSVCASPNLVRDSVFVTVNSTPATPTFISGSASVCDGTTNNVYGVTNDLNVVTYNWNYTGSGETLNGTGNSINFDFAGGATSGNVEVSGTNGCGTSSNATMAVTINSTPSAPSGFSGGSSQCENTTGHNYSVTNDVSVVTYNWSYSGTGETINGSGNAVTFDFAAGATSGNVVVSGTNTCGTGPSTNSLVTINTAPSTPGAITGDISVCQGETGIAYSVTNDVSVVTYNWNYTGAGGSVNGTGSAITVDFSGAATTGNIEVSGTNSCGTSGTQQQVITVHTPSAANPISGNSTPSCGATENYSVVLRGGSSFNWVVPSDVTINLGQGTNIVNIDFGTIDSVLTMIETDANGCDVIGTFAYAQVGCGLDADFTASTTTPCLGNIVTFTDATGASGGATYNWDFGVNAEPQNASGIGPHDVYFTTTGAQNISLTVTDGATDVETKNGFINVNTAPITGNISGPSNPSCNEAGVVYSVPNNAGSTYDWTLSAAGASIIAGDGTESIIVNYGSSDGFLKVVETDANGCTAESYFSGYLSFDGNDYADLGGGNDIDNEDGTLTLWVRTDSDFSDDAFVFYGSIGTTNGTGGGGGNSVSEMHVHFNSNEQIEFFMDGEGSGQNNVEFQSSNSYANGVWHHVAVAWDRNTGQSYMYIDGSQEDIKTDYTSPEKRNFSSVLRLGRPGGNSNYFTGDIDEVSTWDRMLTPQEIRSIYNSASTPSGSSISVGLMTNYQFEEGTGSVLFDSSGVNAHGSLPSGTAEPSRGYVGGNSSPIDKIQAIGVNLLGCGITADFTISGGGTSDTTICSGDALTFTNASSGTTGSTTYEWDFDFNNTGVTILPGNTSTAEGPHSLTISSSTTETVIARLIITEGIIKDTAFYSYIVNSKPTITLDNTVDINCFSALTGQAMVSTVGGDGAYSYNWTNASYTSIGKPDNDTVTGLAAGNYAVIVTDGESCKDSTTYSLSEPGSAVTVSITGYDLSAFGADDGAAKALASGGIGPYHFNWEPEAKIGYPVGTIDGVGNDSIGELEDGLFTLTVTDNNGCTVNDNITITAPSDLLAGSIDINNTTDQFRILCKGDNLQPVTNLTSPTGGASAGASYSFYWQYSTNSFTWTTFPNSLDADAFDPDTAFNNNSLLFVRRCVIDNPQTKCTDAVVYEYKDTLTPVINPLTTDDQFCIDETSVSLDGSDKNASSVFTNLPGITDLGNGFADLDPSSLAPGTYPVEYFITSTDNCTSQVIDSFTVNSLPTPDFTGLQSSYSPGSDPDTLIPIVSTPGGVFSGRGIENGNIFNPAKSDIILDQTDTIYYTYTDPTSGCTNVAKRTFIVSNNIATVSHVNPDPVLQADYCINQGILRMTINKPSVVYPTTDWYIDNDPLGFDYYSGDLDTVHLNISNLTIGRHEVYFAFGDGVNNLTSGVFAFDVHAMPTITLAATFPDQKCEDADSILLYNHINKPSQGYWTFTGSPGIVDAFSDGDASNDTIFKPSDGNIGSVDTLIFTLTEDHGVASCVTIHSEPIQLDSLPKPQITGFQTDFQYCTNDENDTLTASPNGVSRSWSGFGLSFVSPTIRSFDPAPGLANTIDTIVYTVEDINGCENSYSQIIRIDSIPTASITGSTNQICEEDTLDLEGLVGGNTAVGGYPSFFIGSGIIDTDTTDGLARLSANLATPADDYLIQFIYQNSQLCSDTASFTIDVKPLHSISFITEDSSDTYCSNESKVNFNTDAAGEPGSSTFSYDGGARTSNSEFNPQTAGIGQTVVEFFHISSNTQCEAYFVDTFTVYAAPSSDFDVSGVCIADTTQFTDLTTISAGNITDWFWDFNELVAGGDTSVQQNPNYKYSTDGDKWIKLISTSDNGCVDSIRRILTFESNPEASFTWANECEGDVTQFITSTNSSISNWYWDYGDGSQDTINGSLGDTLHQFSVANTYPVTLVVESIDGCTDTIANDVEVREFIDFSTEDFRFFNFESGSDGWIADDTLSSWELGDIPSTNYILNDAASGDFAYITKLDTVYNNNENSSVSGPCFDFSNISKPMFKMKYKSGIFDNDDGAVIQYQYTISASDSTIPWTNLGDFDNGTTTGINWYNSASIDAKPGEIFTRGWTGTSVDENQDTVWLESRHHLDFLKNISGITNVRFRVAFASDNSSAGPGFAFDDIWVGNRTRIVLAEHFTNNSAACTTCESVDTEVDTLIAKNSNPRDVIDIQYHTNNPGNDHLFSSNTSDPNSRILYYSIPSIPYLVMDGNQFTGNSSVWANDSLYMRLRTLIDPQFDIRIGYDIVGNDVNVDVEMVANDTIINEDLSVKVALVEKRVFTTGANGDTEFRNVLRKMLPHAAGRDLMTNWSAINDTVIESYNHTMFNFDDPNQLAVVAFVQNNQTKEVYQAGYRDVIGTITGLPDYISDDLGLDFLIYPNPGSEITNVVFKEALQEDITLDLYNNIGQVMLKMDIDKGSLSTSFDISDLPNGVYFVRTIISNKVAGIRKLVIQH